MEIKLPYNEEAERGVLGALFLDPENIFKINHILEPDDFYLTGHKIIYETILEIFTEGRTFDLITVKNRLKEEGKLEQVGGDLYISSIVDNVPSLKNVEEYAEIIVDKAKVRKLMSVAEQILVQGNRDVNSKQLLSAVEKDLFEVAIGRNKDILKPLGEGIKEVISSIEEMRELVKSDSNIPGISAPFSGLKKIIPIFQPGELIIIAARPSVGKTSFALTSALDAAKKGGVVCIFSLEMPFEQIALRLLCMEGRVNVKKARTGELNEEEFDKLVAASNILSDLKIYIDDSSSLTVGDVRAKLQKLRMDTDGKLDLVLVDYLQLMHGTVSKKEIGNRALEVSQISRGLKILAKDLHTPFVVLSQLNRAIEQRSGGNARPMLSDLRESGSIEQDADIVMFLHKPKEEKKVSLNGNSSRDDKDNSLSEIKLIVAKNRNGPIGTVDLFFDSEFTIFLNDYMNL